MATIAQLEVAIRRGHLRWMRANLQWQQMMEPTETIRENLILVEHELDRLEKEE